MTTYTAVTASVGSTDRWETEGGPTRSLEIPSRDDRLRALAASNVRWATQTRREISPRMDLYGSISNNLASAVQSARRLRGQTVHDDTLCHWTDLLLHARRELAAGSTEPIQALIIQLERELADRAA